MKKELINFKEFSLIPTKKIHNKPTISKEKENIYKKNFAEQEWYNGELMSCEKFEKQNGLLKLYYGKSNFYDFMISYLENKKISPIVCVNAIIAVEDSLVLIKREKNASSCPEWWDFPAGLMPFNETLENRLLNRIENDTLIDKQPMSLELFPLSASYRGYFNFFYNIRYSVSKKILKNFFNKNFENDKPFLLKKSKIIEFLKKNKVVHPKVLEKYFYL
jgi:hypothetical protein